MNNIWTLLKIQLLSFFGFNECRHTKDPKKKRKQRLVLLLFILLIPILLLVSTSYSIIIAQVVTGSLHLLPVLMMTVASLIVLFTTIYKVNGTLFNFKDYDFLMSLPVPTSSVIASRVLMLYAMNLALTLLIMGPAIGVYGFYARPAPWVYPMLIAALAAIPLIPIIIASVIGVIIGFISSRFRHQNVLTILFSLAAVTAIVVGSFSFSTASVDEDALAMAVSTASNQLFRLYPPSAIFSDMVGSGDFFAFIKFIVLSLGCFAVFCVTLSLLLKKINAALTERSAKSNYKITALKTSTPELALLKKELRFYFSCPIYVLNTSTGVLLALIGAVALALWGGGALAQLLEIPELASMLPGFAPLFIAVFVSLTCTSSCSISLEGKNLWLIQTLPVKAAAILCSKILLNLLITLPASLICSLIFVLALPMPSILNAMLTFVTPAVYCAFISVAGLVINLHFPNLNWTSETAVVKRSTSVYIAMLTGLVAAVVPIALYALPFDHMYILAAVTAAVAITTALCYNHLRKSGEGALLRLGEE